MIYEKAVPNELGYRDASVTEVVAARGNVRIVDVREPDEYVGELGHLEGAELVPLAAVEQKAADWDKAQEIVLVCRSGGRSGRAAAALARMGFQKVVNMAGGMLAVNEAKLPVVR
jgi:rhodanese-related sulfurtransferase